ncbi:hypothetical protein A2U01_0108218, partial [Trifolium medium]|nr:hypothetical protein [Trifolium medium]
MPRQARKPFFSCGFVDTCPIEPPFSPTVARLDMARPIADCRCLSPEVPFATDS